MAKIVPKRVLEEIRFRNDIVETVSRCLDLKRSGNTFKALCPFHKEKTPSFHVNPQRQIYHCFGCGAGGDVFAFVQQYEGVDFMTAVRMLAERAGVQLDLEDGEPGVSNKQALFDLLADVAQRYHRVLLETKSGARARRYLAQRDLSEAVIADFQIGYAPNRWDAVLNWGRKQKFPVERLEEAGLIVAGSKPGAQGRYYDRFRNRVMFPIRDEQGRVIGFSGRTLDDAADAAKYVNSPETPVFRKSRVLYGLDRARRAVTEAREAILCEGQIDVIRCHQAGFPAAVAPQGTALTEDQVRMVRRYADGVVLVFDPDRAGQDAAVRAAGVAIGAGLAVRVAALPPGQDPDTLIRERGARAFGEILEQAGSAVHFQIEVLSRRENVRSEVGLMRVARAVLGTISRTPNAVQRAALVQEAASLLNIPVSALQDDLRTAMRRSRGTAPARGGAADGTARRSARPLEEVELCEHLARVDDLPEIGVIVSQYLPLE
ncbi:MAG: DNA primase, partial [Lentisphaerae bacterium]|nr:DNA primase [Lentisphaerota bacterium]